MGEVVPDAPLAVDWNERLRRAFKGTLVFKSQRDSGKLLIRGDSSDGRAILELTSAGRVLREASLQMALSDGDDLEALRLGFWSLLFLRSLFPGWTGMERWIQSAAARRKVARGSLTKNLDGYSVTCRYDLLARVLTIEARHDPATL
jgi:hypothetical protein